MAQNKGYHSASEQISGYVAYKKGKPVQVAEYIRETMEDATRFVCSIMGHSPAGIWKMDVYEFFRDLVRAEKRQQAQIKQLEKWQKK